MAKSMAFLVLGALLMLLEAQFAAAAHWGSFTRSNCQRPGFRKWYARLWDIKGDWGNACRSTPANVNNFYFPAPDNCVDKGVGGMWGEFYVPDGGCRNVWGEFQKGIECSAVKPGFRKYVSKLEVDEQTASLRGLSVSRSSQLIGLCRAKDANIEGVHFDQPDQCVFKSVEGVFGEFLIRDYNCDAGNPAIEEVV